VGAKQNPLLPLRVPRHNQIRHVDRVTRERMANAERLPPDLASKLLEVVDQQFLLLPHPVGTTKSRTKCANLLEIRKASLRLDRDLIQCHRGLGFGR
jgi:hypothetical protein